jgi:hypothetical protein
LLKNYPEYDRIVHAGENSAELDLFIDEIDYAHKSLGSIIILDFFKNVIFINNSIKKYVIRPEPKNIVVKLVLNMQNSLDARRE